MFTKTHYTKEELCQISVLNKKLSLLRSYAARYDMGQPIDKVELQGVVDDILENVAPMAERLGLSHEQSELQDTCVRIGYPEDYAHLKQLLQEASASCEMVFKTFALPLKAMIADLGIDFDFQYRMKSIYSIWRKMRVDHKEFDDVYDLFATRIIYKVPDDGKIPWDIQKVPAVSDIRTNGTGNDYIDVEKLYCWRIYNVIAMLYRIHPDRTKNWITHPKPSGYQALQMTVMGPDCNWIEIQIRSERMDYEAEHGIAAHWMYKEETAVK